MRVNWKKVLSVGLVVASIIMVFWIAFSNRELENAWDALGSLSPIWVFGAFCCWFSYMFFDAFSAWIYLRSEGFKISLGRAVNASLVGFYYSNITPSSAGGQPMQVNSLRKAGIPVGYGTMVATIRLACNQFAVCAMSLIFWLCNREFVARQLGDAIWFARLGWVINFAGIPLILMAAFMRNLIQKIMTWLIRTGAKIHLIKTPDATIAITTEVLDTYHTALMELTRRPGQILLQMACSCLSISGLIGTIYFVCHAFGLSGTPWYHLITISFLLYISACYTPLPGASGAQEGGFLLYYQGIFPGDRIGLALLVWRFFTYYLFLIVGVFNVILDKVLASKERQRKHKKQDKQSFFQSSGEKGEE